MGFNKKDKDSEGDSGVIPDGNGDNVESFVNAADGIEDVIRDKDEEEDEDVFAGDRDTAGDVNAEGANGDNEENGVGISLDGIGCLVNTES